MRLAAEAEEAEEAEDIEEAEDAEEIGLGGVFGLLGGVVGLMGISLLLDRVGGNPSPWSLNGIYSGGKELSCTDIKSS